MELNTMSVHALSERVENLEQQLAAAEAIIEGERDRAKEREIEYHEQRRMREDAEAELERLQCQLAGCGVAALGYGEDCKKGDWGWSASYQDVVALRARYESVTAELSRLRGLVTFDSREAYKMFRASCRYIGVTTGDGAEVRALHHMDDVKQWLKDHMICNDGSDWLPGDVQDLVDSLDDPDAWSFGVWSEHFEDGSVQVIRLSSVLYALDDQQSALASPAAEPVPQHKLDGLLRQIELQENQINELQARVNLMKRHNGEDFWYWQNDGEDYPESMASDLPVVIRADHLRALIAQPAPVAQSEQSQEGEQ